MQVRSGLVAASLGAVLFVAQAGAGETPKFGGTLAYMIPADAPPSLDGHRETTYATVHSAAPFYSVLIRINPENPSSTTDFVCDLCTAMPQPTDDGKTYTFKIRDGVKFHDGSPLTSADVAASWIRLAGEEELGSRRQADHPSPLTADSTRRSAFSLTLLSTRTRTPSGRPCRSPIV